MSVEMTEPDILSLAVNVAQNDGSLDENHSAAVRVMLGEVLAQILKANRRAVVKRLVERGRWSSCRVRPETTPFGVDRYRRADTLASDPRTPLG